MGRIASTVALLVLASAGCKASGCGESSSTSEPAEAAAPIASGAKADAGPVDPIVNLLYTTPAVVAVSSKVDNPKDFPEHLIDGKPETAWNGKTGDLVGGWIAFRVPQDAHVNVIAMSAGFDKRSKTGDDLFSQNHRIARVRVSRNGAALKEVSFNLGKRTPQDIKVDAAGGDFKIEVLEVAPGTKAEWRELTVSELAVWGTRGATRLEGTHLPSVRVGGLDAVDAGADAGAAPASGKPTRGPFASLAAFCASHEAEWKPRFAAEKDDYPGFIEGPYCTVSGEALLSEKAPARILEARVVVLTTHDARNQHVAIKTRRGWFITPAIVGTEELRNPGCAGGCSDQPAEVRLSAATPRMPLVVTHRETCWSNPWPGASDGYEDDPGSRHFQRTADVCTVADDGTPSCRSFTTGTATRPYLPADTFDEKWNDTKAEKVLHSGELVFE
ncbi:MAG: hypothetical protein JWM74_2895 [Myxococcaceae bacterium]|nr:hypothetical protein [Myxococcaceae bacterium]